MNRLEVSTLVRLSISPQGSRRFLPAVLVDRKLRLKARNIGPHLSSSTFSQISKVPYPKQDRQFTCNVTMGRFRATIVAGEKQRVLHKVSVFICCLRYPACNAQAPYCHLWPSPFYKLFSHYLMNGRIFEKKKVMEHNTYVSLY
jgi:hypothetical protein